MRKNGVIQSILALFCILLSSCQFDSLELKGNEREDMPELTSKELIKMSPDEVAKYYAERNAKKEKMNRKEEQDEDIFSIFSLTNSQKKRKRLGDVSKPLANDSDNAVFPWSESDNRRSSTLLDKDSAVYDW